MKSTKSRSMIALAIAGAFACAGAYAGGAHQSTEVHTPASVSESAPWLTGQPHLAGWTAQSFDTTIGFQEGQFSDGPQATGASSGMSGTGSGGFDSTGYDASRSDAGMTSDDRVATVEYWLIGEPTESSLGTGMSSSTSGSGSVGFESSSSAGDTVDLSMSGTDSFDVAMEDSGFGSFDNSADSAWSDYAYDSSSSHEPLSIVYTPSAEMIAGSFGEATPLLSEHYLVMQPLSEFDHGDVIVLELGTAPEDIALLQALSSDFYVLTPAYDEG